MRAMRARHPRGFTLIELFLALSILAIMAALSVAALGSIQRRAEVGAIFGDVAGAVRLTRAQAMANGARTAFVVDTVGKRWWGLDAPTGLNLDTFDPAAPGTVITSGTLPDRVSFGPAEGYGGTLAAPFAGIPVRADAPVAPALNYCSYCRSGAATKTGFGLVIFESDGRARFESTAPKTVGHQFTLTGAAETGTRTMAVAIVAQTGLVETFDK